MRNPSKPSFPPIPQAANSKFTNADDLTELIEHDTIENGDGYELRVYPASKWVCTKEYDVDPINDPMNGWQETVSRDVFHF